MLLSRSPSGPKKYFPIPVAHLEEEIRVRSADDCKRFREEFNVSLEVPCCSCRGVGAWETRHRISGHVVPKTAYTRVGHHTVPEGFLDTWLLLRGPCTPLVAHSQDETVEQEAPKGPFQRRHSECRVPKSSVIGTRRSP